MDGTVLLPPFPSRPCCRRVNVTRVRSATQPRDYGGVPRLGAGCLLGQGASPRRCCTETLGSFSRSGMEGKLPGWIQQQGARDFSLEAVGEGGSHSGEGRWAACADPWRAAPLKTHWLCPRQDFDRLLEAMKSALAEDSRTAFVFNCSSGRGRTTTAMVIAVLTLWHFNVGIGVRSSPWGSGWSGGCRGSSVQPAATVAQ